MENFKTKLKAFIHTKLAVHITLVILIVALIVLTYNSHGLGGLEHQQITKQYTFSFNNQEFKTDFILYQDRILVPVKTLEVLMLDSETVLIDKYALISHKDDHTNVIQITDGSEFIWKYLSDGYIMDVPAWIIDDEMYVSIRHISNIFEYKIQYVEQNNKATVTINKTPTINKDIRVKGIKRGVQS